jgi:hypothetical protein
VGGELWVGGQFLTAGAAPSAYVARWDQSIVAVPIAPDPRVLASAPSFAAVVSPNPARGPATIRLAVRSAGRFQVDLFDVVGRRIRRLLDDPLGPGEHAVLWDGCDAGGRATPPGVYFWRVCGDADVRTGKVVRLGGAP